MTKYENLCIKYQKQLRDLYCFSHSREIDGEDGYFVIPNLSELMNAIYDSLESIDGSIMLIVGPQMVAGGDYETEYSCEVTDGIWIDDVSVQSWESAEDAALEALAQVKGWEVV